MPHAARPRISAEDLARDRAFWADLLEQRAQSSSLPAHTAGGYRNRRFAIIRDAAWITLYRAATPSPQVGVFLRCTGLAGDAFFAMADQARPIIAQRLKGELGPGEDLHWGASYHPGMTDIATMMAAPLPWDEAAASVQIAWLLQKGAVWWNTFASLVDE